MLQGYMELCRTGRETGAPVRVGRRRAVLMATALILTLGTATSAHAENCAAPAEPAIPDGAEASLEAMIAGQQAVKAFQAANMAYMQCLEQSFGASKKVAENASDAAQRALAENAYARAFEAYNTAVSTEEAIAGAFNIELREYKAANR